MNNRNCENCIFYKDLSLNTTKCCHYALITGKLRGCDVENCDKKIGRSVYIPHKLKIKLKKYKSNLKSY